MKRFLFFLILLAAGFTAGFGAARWKAVELFAAKVAASKLSHRPMEFRPTPYPLENRPFRIVIVGRNNGANLEKTLQSVFLQNYENFRILYIDDASDDGSGDLARDLMTALVLRKSNSTRTRSRLVPWPAWPAPCEDFPMKRS
jgi:hypothetical protein